jgi:hypothetical protein
LLVGLPGLFLLFEVAAKRPEIEDYVTRMPGGAETLVVAGSVLVIIGLAILAWGMTKRNATEMAVTNRRVLIKTGLGNRRTPDEWCSRHGFRRGIASNLYELRADEKIVQRVLRHAKAPVTKDRYIKAFDPGSARGDAEDGDDFGRHETLYTNCAPN